MLGSGLNLVSAALGFGMTAVFIAFVCARFICCRARGADGSTPPPLDFHTDLDRPIEHARCGLEPLVVDAIPTMKYNTEFFQSKDDAYCSICLGEYNDKEILRIIPTCRHDFHLTCLDVWLQKQTSCPICRASLKELPDKKAMVASESSIPQLAPVLENSVDPTPELFIPIHQGHRGQQNRPFIQEPVEVVIEFGQ